MAGPQPTFQLKTASGSNVAFMLRALRYRNYRLFFGGQIVSLTGTWITTTATSWLVYRLTGSAMLLGVVGFASQFPAFLLTPFAGIFVDRWNRHRLLVATQTLLMLTSFALAMLPRTGTISIGSLLVVSVVQGLVTAFDMPTRQAFVVTLIEDKNDLGNAIALNSSMFNAARLLGPTVAGAIIAASAFWR
jgi:MFS family permease